MRQSHAAVLDEVRRALRQREGLIVVTGAPGTGTASLCRTLVQELEPGVCASLVLDPRVTVDDLLLHVLNDFGVIGSVRNPALNGAPTLDQLMRALQHFLASLIPVWGCAVLVIDEAQDLDAEVLQQHLRRLLNFETDGEKLLQIVLVGQPELNHLLRHESLKQLDECVARRCELDPPTLAEPLSYPEELVPAAQALERIPEVTVLEPEDIGADMPVSTLTYTSAISVVATRSHGVPQMIELVCDGALDIGRERRIRRVDWRLARTVGSHAFLRALPSRVRTANRATIAAAAVVLMGVVGLGVRWSASGAVLPAAVPPAQFANADSQLVVSKSIDVKALPGVDSFNVRVASFRAAASATALKARLEAAGLPAFIRIERGGLHYVIVGPYLSYAETAGVQARLAGFGHPGSDVFVEYFEPPGARAGINDSTGLMARSQVLQ